MGMNGITPGYATTAVPGLASFSSTYFTVSAAGAVSVVGATGTGNFVLATSPTLVTPALGVATGTSLGLTDTTLDATGDELLSLTGTIGANGGTENGVTLALTNNNVTTANTAAGVDTTVTNSANFANTVYGYKALLNGSGIPGSGTLSMYGGYFETSQLALGSVAGTINTYGVFAKASATSTVDSGTFNHYGVYVANGSANTNGTTANYGLYVEAINSADTNYAAYFAGGNVYIKDSLLINGTAAYGNFAQLLETNAATTRGGIALNGWANSDSEMIVEFQKAKSGTIGTHGAVAVGDTLGNMRFTGSDGTAFRGSAQIKAVAEGTIASTRVPSYLAFFTGTDAAPTVVTEAMRIDSAQNVGIGATSFGTSAAKVLSVATGTAPSTGPADTVQFYSSDDAAGHTIPSFFCEGTNVVATGQGDSASSVRVKMRINGTVYTFLCI